ncbi:hypothetical protein [Lentzea flava]|uniref:Uncharacterized protein n=1 Tax=Lentzea flava TaxID=103732 RepID=A0ABQ2U948_9PSEU|nr:hypothetical protein [Lentzea flava]MCP2197046.1 hypothetical protein [Lentzea flava]GGU13722.1 hypothetical protein GCM10010178_01190 [Lentzea flava]
MRETMAQRERIVVVGAADLGARAAACLARRFGPVDFIGPGADALAGIGVRRYPRAIVRDFDLDTPAVIVDNDGGRLQRLVCDRLVVVGWPVPLLPVNRWVIDGKVAVAGTGADLTLLSTCFDLNGRWRPALADYQFRRQAAADSLA